MKLTIIQQLISSVFIFINVLGVFSLAMVLFTYYPLMVFSPVTSFVSVSLFFILLFSIFKVIRILIGENYTLRWIFLSWFLFSCLFVLIDKNNIGFEILFDFYGIGNFLAISAIFFLEISCVVILQLFFIKSLKKSLLKTDINEAKTLSIFDRSPIKMVFVGLLLSIIPLSIGHYIQGIQATDDSGLGLICQQNDDCPDKIKIKETEKIEKLRKSLELR